MAISGDLTVSATLGSYHHHLHAPPHTHPSSTVSSSKVDFSGFLIGGTSTSDVRPKWPRMILEGKKPHGHSQRSAHITRNNNVSRNPISQDAESFLLNAISMSFFERLNLAWKIIFPSPTIRSSSNARIAKQRLQMILFSDRCAVSDEAKRLIVNNIVRTLSDFVEIESQDKVQLDVSTDTDLGTVYSVSVPVRRVKPEYQLDNEVGAIQNVDYKDTGDSSGSSVDVRFDFYIPE